MNILVTGATGFVGSHFVDYIRKTVPDAMLYATRRWRSRDDNIRHLYGDDHVVFIESDLLDRGSLRRCIETAKPDYVFHFAAQSYPQASFVTPVATLQTNGIGTVNLLEELLGAVQRGLCDPTIVSCASSEVYGNPLPEEVPIKETNPIRAANPYSISKVTHDLFSQYYYQAYGLKVVTTRLFSHEGARRGKTFALSSFAHQIVEHERKYVEIVNDFELSKVPPFFEIRVGNLDSVRTYAHVYDAIEAYWLVAQKGVPGQVYNIGGNYTCRVGDALENLLSKSTLTRDMFRVVVDPKRLRLTDITLQIPDCTKFKTLTGWEPKKTIDNITQDLLDYWRSVL